MTDLLIRDVPEEVIAALDTRAARLGLSRSEYVRRRLAQDAATPGSPVSVQDLARFASMRQKRVAESPVFIIVGSFTGLCRQRQQPTVRSGA